MAKKKVNTIDGLNERHVAQIIRSKMREQKIDSKKKYNRNKIKEDDRDN